MRLLALALLLVATACSSTPLLPTFDGGVRDLARRHATDLSSRLRDLAAPQDAQLLSPEDLAVRPDLRPPPTIDMAPAMCLPIASNCSGANNGGCCAGEICGFPFTGIQPQHVCCVQMGDVCALKGDCCFDPNFGGMRCIPVANGKMECAR